MGGEMRLADPAAAGDTIRLARAGGIAVVTINRPQARNALTFAMYERLAEICAAIEPGAGVGCVVLTGAGGEAFAAGTDIAEFRAFGSAEDAFAYEHRMDRILATVETCAVPVVAAVAGACTGGGAAIAAACDLRIAAANLRFGFPIARTLGNCLSVASLARLVALAGEGLAREMLLTARLVEADEARRSGLVNEVVPTAAAALARAEDLARRIAGHAPLTVRATRQALLRLRHDGSRADDRDLIALCYTSDDFRAGLEAFLAKRPYKWTGR